MTTACGAEVRLSRWSCSRGGNFIFLFPAGKAWRSLPSLSLPAAATTAAALLVTVGRFDDLKRVVLSVLVEVLVWVRALLRGKRAHTMVPAATREQAEDTSRSLRVLAYCGRCSCTIKTFSPRYRGWVRRDKRSRALLSVEVLHNHLAATLGPGYRVPFFCSAQKHAIYRNAPRVARNGMVTDPRATLTPFEGWCKERMRRTSVKTSTLQRTSSVLSTVYHYCVACILLALLEPTNTAGPPAQLGLQTTPKSSVGTPQKARQNSCR